MSKEKNNNNLWSDDELKTSVDAYIYMLGLEQSGVSFSTRELSNFLSGGPLSGRNDASIRYRMRNISYILDYKNFPTLSSYSPAAHLGSGVRKRLERILDERYESLAKISEQKNEITQPRLDDVINKLDLLAKSISEMDTENRVGIGHNNPPEPLDELGIDSNRVNISIQNIKIELNSNSPDEEKISTEQNIILKFGLWCVIAFIGGGIAVAGETLLGPLIIDTLTTLASYISILG